MYDTYMSTPGNTAKLGAIHSNIQTAQRGPSLVGSEPTKLSTLSTQHSTHYMPANNLQLHTHIQYEV